MSIARTTHYDHSRSRTLSLQAYYTSMLRTMYANAFHTAARSFEILLEYEGHHPDANSEIENSHSANVIAPARRL